MLSYLILSLLIIVFLSVLGAKVLSISIPLVLNTYYTFVFIKLKRLSKLFGDLLLKTTKEGSTLLYLLQI